MVPMPTSLCAPPPENNAISAIANSGAEDPIAISDAPATSSDSLSRRDI